MNIYCIGDSLTEGDYGVFGKRGIANVKKENYPFFLSQILDTPTFNFGFCGITSKQYFERYQNGEFDFSSADIILVMLGTNAGLDGEFKECYINLIKSLEKDYPNADVILITSPHATENPEYSNCGYAGNVKSAVSTAREFAASNGNKLVDLASYSEFTAESEKIMQPNDGLHYGETGYRHIATFVAKALAGFFPDKLSLKKQIV